MPLPRWAHYDPQPKPSSASDKSDATRAPSYTIVNNQKRSGPIGSSLSQPAAASSPLATIPPTLPATLLITFSTSIKVPITISPSSSADDAPIYNLHTQTVQAPHLSLFARNSDSPEAEEIATATIADKGGAISCVVREKGVKAEPKGKMSSGFLATIPGLGSVVWKGDRQALTCSDQNDNLLAKLVMHKGSKANDWVVTATWEFMGAGPTGEWSQDEREMMEALLMTGLAVQESKKRKGGTIWGNIGSGGLNSTMI